MKHATFCRFTLGIMAILTPLLAVSLDKPIEPFTIMASVFATGAVICLVLEDSLPNARETHRDAAHKEMPK